MSWQETVKRKREDLNSRIPNEWFLEEGLLSKLKSEKLSLSENLDEICPDSENEITHSNISAIKEKLAKKELSCYEVAYAFCHRAALIHQVVNCLTEIMFDEALARAKSLDANRPSELPPLYGIPISLKDQFNVEGFDTTLGYVGRAFTPKKKEEESLVVSCLRDLGAVLYVKTTVPPSIMSPETASNLFGYTFNSVNQTFSCGGSTGGEGALIAARGSLVGMGTDIGGSIRIPSSYQGIYGFRPSHGLFPYLNVDNSFEGQQLMPSVVGPLAKNLEDLFLVTDALINVSKPWTVDVRSSPYKFEPKGAPQGSKKELVVGFWYDDGVVEATPNIKRALERCEKIVNETPGMRSVKWDPPKDLNNKIFHLAVEIFKADGGEEIRKDFEASGEPFPDNVAMIYGDFRGRVINVTEWFELSKRKYGLQQQYRAFLNSKGEEKPDVIVCPSRLFPFKPTDVAKATSRYTRPFNVLDFPCLVVPVSKVDCSIDGTVDTTTALSDEDLVSKEYWNNLVRTKEVDNFPVCLQVVSPTFEANDVCRFGSWLSKQDFS